jgi:hypothetical protein
MINETTRQALTYTLHDFENSLRINQEWLVKAQRDVVAFQAKVNHDKHRIAEINETLAAMNGENK